MRTRTTLLIFLVVIGLIAGAGVVYYRSQDPLTAVREQAVNEIKNHVEIAEVSDFYWFNTQEVYYSISGKDQQGEEFYAVLTPETKEVTVLYHKQVITEDEAKSITLQNKNPQKILSARLGKLDGEVVWEVSYQMTGNSLGYYYISTLTGEWVKDIENI